MKRCCSGISTLTFRTLRCALRDTKGFRKDSRVFSGLLGLTRMMYLTFFLNGLDKPRYADTSSPVWILLLLVPPARLTSRRTYGPYTPHNGFIKRWTPGIKLPEHL